LCESLECHEFPHFHLESVRMRKQQKVMVLGSLALGNGPQIYFSSQACNFSTHTGGAALEWPPHYNQHPPPCMSKPPSADKQESGFYSCQSSLITRPFPKSHCSHQTIPKITRFLDPHPKMKATRRYSRSATAGSHSFTESNQTKANLTSTLSLKTYHSLDLLHSPKSCKLSLKPINKLKANRSAPSPTAFCFHSPLGMCSHLHTSMPSMLLFSQLGSACLCF
jgi:hypothetical protein